MNRHLVTLPIRQDTKQKLQKFGIDNVTELRSYKPLDLLKRNYFEIFKLMFKKKCELFSCWFNKRRA